MLPITEETYNRIMENGKILDTQTKKIPKNSMIVNHYATGGQMDQQLSDNSFQVKGNPNVTDGNYYPEYNANLDHNEVVKDSFVYSNKLKIGGASFAEHAKKIEKSTGKAEKMLKVSPHDETAKNTIKLNEQKAQSLALAQETLATMKGHRNPSRNFAMGGDTGGPQYVSVPTFGMGLEKFYDPATDKFYTRVPIIGNYVEAPYDNTFATSYKQKNPQAPVAQQPTTGSLLPGNAPGPTNWRSTAAAPTARRTQKSNGPVKSALPNGPVNENYKDPQMEYWMNFNKDSVSKYNVDPLQPIDMLRRSAVAVGSTMDGQPIIPSSTVQVTSNRNAALPTIPTVSGSNNIPTVAGSSSNNNWATGDYLQAAKVLSGFGQLVGGAEKEKPNYDTTNISQNVYDPSNALYQNQRNYKDAINGFDGPSINTRRAYANAMYANKLGQDDAVVSQYQQMNQQGKQQYEQRTADQRRYNIGQTTYTNDMNARNRSAYKEAVDAAFTGLSNFGVGLNGKQQAGDVLNILKTQYPDVWAKIYGGLK